jgi:hypothetical protein
MFLQMLGHFSAFLFLVGSWNDILNIHIVDLNKHI